MKYKYMVQGMSQIKNNIPCTFLTYIAYFSNYGKLSLI